MIGLWQQGSQLYTPVAITQSDSVSFPPARPLKFLIILTADAMAGDTVSIVDLEGDTHVITLPVFDSGAAYPICLPFGIRRVNATNTTLEDAEMIGGR